jgi:drug/metabolite transporter (DMT)-like permease
LPSWASFRNGKAAARISAAGLGGTVTVLAKPEHVEKKRTFLKQDALLILTAAIWGFAFVAQRAGMQFVGPFTFNGVRFALGSLSLLPLIFFRKARRNDNNSIHAPGKTFLFGLLAGTVLFLGASLQQIGIVYTTAGKCGFITGLYVVLVPISGLLWGQKAGWSRWIGAVLAVSGLYFLSVAESFTISKGDFLVLLSAFFWTAHVQILGRFSPRADSVRLACIQFAVCSLLSLLLAVITETIVSLRRFFRQGFRFFMGVFALWGLPIPFR